MPRFRLRPEFDSLDLYEPAGGPNSLHVESGQIVDSPGRLITSRPAPVEGEPPPEPLPDDAWIVENDGVERAWPKALWDLADNPAPAPAPRAAADVTED